MTLLQAFEKTVSDFEQAPAIRNPSGEISYGQLSDAVRRLSRGLKRLGIERGDRIGIMLPDVPHFVIAYYAAFRLGAVCVPISLRLSGDKLALLLEDCEATALIGWSKIVERVSPSIDPVQTLRHKIILGESSQAGASSMTAMMARSAPLVEVAELDDDDPAVIWYGSGFTMRPKGAELSHGAIASNAISCRDLLGIKQGDVIAGSYPLFKPTGQTLIMNLAITVGGTIRLEPGFDPEEAASRLQSGQINTFVGSPQVFNSLIRTAASFQEPSTSLRNCVCAGGHLDDDSLRDFERRFGGYVLECYTMSETGPVCSFNQWRTGRRVGSLGHPLSGVEMRVLDKNGREAAIGETGEIAVKGVNLMRAYIGRPKLTGMRIKNGWFLTGDFGRMDINGYFYLTGKNDGRFAWNMDFAHLSEIEAILRHHNDISEIAAVEHDGSNGDKQIKICAVLKSGATATTEQISDYCREHLGIDGFPLLVRLYKDLPRLPDGHVNRTELLQ